MIKVFCRSLGVPFYSAHIGFFLLLLIFSTVFMRPPHHIFLAKLIASSEFIILLLLILFALYHLKAVSFIRRTIARREYLFIGSVALLTGNMWVVIWLILFAIVSLPLLLYSIFVSIFIVNSGSHLGLMMLFMYWIFTAWAFIVYISRRVQQPVPEDKKNLGVNYFDQYFIKPFALWMFFLLLKSKPLLLLFSKVISVVLLMIFFRVHQMEHYDERFLAFGMVVSSLANMILAYEYYGFYVHRLSWIRSLPQSTFDRLKASIIFHLLLLLPEILVVIRSGMIQVSMMMLVQMILYILVQMIFYEYWLLFRQASLEYYVKIVLYLTVIQIFLILFGVPLYVFICLMFLVVLCIERFYYIFHN